MAFSRTQIRYLAASPEAVWDILSTPSLWPAFADDLQSFEPLDAPSLIGPGGPRRLRMAERVRVLPHARVRGALHALTAPAARISELQTDAVVEWTQDQPAGATLQRYELTPHGAGTLLTRTTRAAGPLALVLWPALGGALSGDLGAVAARLVAMAGCSDPAAARQPLVVVAGGSGYLGSLLTHELLARGRDVVVLTRHPRTGLPYRQVAWDGATTGPWASLLADPRGVDIVNLAGHPIGGAGAAEAARLSTSRLNATRVLARAAQAAGVVVHHWVQASGVVLRLDPDEPTVHESTPALPADGEALRGMTELVRRWEEASAQAPAAHRTVIRTGIVLGHDAAAFRALRAVATVGGGGAMAGGRQWVPWIHEDDWLRIARAGLGIEEGVALPDGPVIAAAPHPVTNARLMEELRSRVAPAGLGLPTPKALLKLGTGVLGKDDALLTGSARAVSEVLPAAGFAFRHETLGTALDASLS